MGNSSINPIYSPSTLARIRDTDIRTVAADFGIKTRGRQVFCFAHQNTRTPAANFYQNTIYCHVCQRSWDAIDLYRQFHGLNFRDAVAALARDYGIVLPEGGEPLAATLRRQRARREAEKITAYRDGCVKALRARLWSLWRELRRAEAAWQESADDVERDLAAEVAFILQVRASEIEAMVCRIESATPEHLIQAYRALHPAANRRAA